MIQQNLFFSLLWDIRAAEDVLRRSRKAISKFVDCKAGSDDSECSTPLMVRSDVLFRTEQQIVSEMAGFPRVSALMDKYHVQGDSSD
jgi:hypothetical protein